MRDDGHGVFVGTAGADGVVVAQAVGDLLEEREEGGFGEGVGWVGGFDVEGGFWEGGGVFGVYVGVLAFVTVCVRRVSPKSSVSKSIEGGSAYRCVGWWKILSSDIATCVIFAFLLSDDCNE